MKKFEKLQIEVIKITTEDIIMTSATPQSLNYGKGDDHTGVGVGSTTGDVIFK